MEFYGYVEDALTRSVVLKIAALTGMQFKSDFPAVENGCGNLYKKAAKFASMARNGLHVALFTDLDTAECAPSLRRKWFGNNSIPDSLLFRVAVRETEAWIMADKEAFARYVGISPVNFKDDPETLGDPKQFLLAVIKKHASPKLKKAMIPSGSAAVGPEYNSIMCDFAEHLWNPERAAKHAPSLQRTFNAIKRII